MYCIFTGLYYITIRYRCTRILTMLKKCMSTVLLLCFSLMMVSAAEKNDTASGAQIKSLKQATTQSLAKQSKIIPKNTSNWSKIKDLFM